MKVIVGLGNPGREYADTRHNVGFRVADLIGERLSLQWRSDGDGMFAKSFGAAPFFVLKPQGFMNRSGYAVSRFAGYHHIEPRDVLVVGAEALRAEIRAVGIPVREPGDLPGIRPPAPAAAELRILVHDVLRHQLRNRTLND